MINSNSKDDYLSLLRKAGLRPTRQRLALCRLLFGSGDRHITAETLHSEIQSEGLSVSLATIYNTLHQFTDANLLKQVVVDPTRTYFDTNLSDHHHFFLEGDGVLMDLPDCGRIELGEVPSAPEGTRIKGVDVIVRLAAV
jgi:Fur family transcriptional regulator, iron response regulator